MQMQEAVDDIQLNLTRQRVSKLPRLATRRLRADENLAVRKRDDIGRTGFVKKFSVQR